MSLALIVQILQIGFVGLAFLLAYLAYRLLSAQSRKQAPSQQMIDATSKYMAFSVVLAFFAVAVQGLQTWQTRQRLDVPADVVSMRAEITHLNSRVDGIRLVAIDRGRSEAYGCGSTQKVEPTTLVVMYGIRDGTSCGVGNLNFYKEIAVDVPK